MSSSFSFRALRTIVLIAALATTGLAASTLAAEAEAGTPGGFLVALQQPAADDGFVPVYDLPPDEQLPAAPLLVGAYAFAWVMVLGYLWGLWRKLAKVEREMADVARRVDALRRP